MTSNALTLFNSPLFSSEFSFDHASHPLKNFPDVFSNVFALFGEEGYPKYNLVEESETDYRLEMALAGFAKSEISVDLQDNVLTISGEKVTSPKSENSKEIKYIHKGISERKFCRQFRLGDGIEIQKAAMDNGILTVNLHLNQPESKTKKIRIA